MSQFGDFCISGLGAFAAVDTFRIQLEDGSGFILLEDNSGYIIKEDAP